jgi:hypothetical protein
MSRFVTGNTGRSTGPHLDLQVFNPATGAYEDPAKYTSFLTVGDNKDPFSYEITSPRGMREHPVLGGQRMHEGIDYATPTGTVLNVNGNLLSTWEDDGGGIMSQYAINTDDGVRELLLLHGDRSNAITGTGAVTDYDIDNLPTASPIATADDQPDRAAAKEVAQDYSKMSKAELNAAYDAMRGDDELARTEGMKMHKAFFNKP